MTNIAFYIGETWTIQGTAVDADGVPMNLTGGSVEFRVASDTAGVLKALSPADIAIDTGTGGTYTLTIAATDSRQTSLVAGDYTYEVDAVDASNAVSVQNRGKLTLKKSLRALYP